MFKKGRFSGYLRPLSYIIDLSIINVLAYICFSDNFQIL
ncbi:MAG: putative colanic acid biosynthesis UDP-glucose lipid carrier transferase, partial [Saprospiraceae bacterium]